MKRFLTTVSIALLVGTSQVRAEFLQMDLSIFGMD
jgi:hypothetical protein